MVKQGQIIKTDFSPQLGHEQAGYRPALVVSNALPEMASGMIVLCPITSTKRNNGLHIPIEEGLITKGFVMCDQLKSVDLSIRPYNLVETVSDDFLWEICDTIKGMFDTVNDLMYTV
jgi:mRNA interferase MazF